MNEILSLFFFLPVFFFPSTSCSIFFSTSLDCRGLFKVLEVIEVVEVVAAAAAAAPPPPPPPPQAAKVAVIAVLFYSLLLLKCVHP